MPESDLVSAVNAPAGVAVDWSGRLSRRTQGRTDAGIGGILALANARDIINFSGGFPDPGVFPVGQTREILDRLLDDDVAVALQYAPSEGVSSTRNALAIRLLATQGRRPGDDELMVTSGGIDAITLISRSMLDPGDEVLVEAPTYLGAVAGFTGFDARVTAVPTGPDGLDVEALAGLLATSTTPPKLLYTIPDYQNPSGSVLETSRREALVDLCRRYGVLIVEDVAYRELGFDDSDRPSLWSIAPDITVQIGTFSKVFFPGIRLGWAAGPAPVIAELVVAKQNSDQCAGALGQRLVEEYLRGGHLDRALPRARELYRSRGLEMDAALTRHFGGVGEWTTPRGGFFCWLRVPGADTTALAPAALAAAVAYVPGEGFFTEPGNVEYLRLSFSRVEQHEIDPGIARLADIVRATHG
ncbi:MAG: PLP-dependent aminotransferase family protein [Nocardioides sp.]